MKQVARGSLLVALLVSGACAVRQETQVFVVVVPDGFASVGVDAGPFAEVLGTVVVEARGHDTTPPCASRDTAATSVAASVDALHTSGGTVHTVSVAVADAASPLWITVWGKVEGRDRARRSFLVQPAAGSARVLCVGLAPAADDCQCADGASLLALEAASGVDAAVAMCEALARSREPQLGVSDATACTALTIETCVGPMFGDASTSFSCAAPEDAGAPRDTGSVDASDARGGG